MAASTKKQVHVQYDVSDSGSEGDSEGSIEENGKIQQYFYMTVQGFFDTLVKENVHFVT